MRPRSPLRKAVALIISAGLVVLSATVFMQRDFVYDSWRAYNFTPTAEVAAMPSDTGMSTKGQLLFFASHPTLEGSQTFNKLCQNTEKNSMVIGCYTGGNIFLYDVNHSEIQGVEPVTAAHEMLHAAYERLSNSERQEVDGLLLDQASRLQDSPEFRERMTAYSSLSSRDQLNEYHSIFGTEVDRLPPLLEDYYQQYFADRSKTVALYKRYAEVFRGLKRDAENLASSIDRLASQINNLSADYEQDSRQLSSDIRQFNARASSGDFDSQFSFDIERNRLVARSNALDAEYGAVQGMIEQYNSQLDHYNQVAAHLTQLTNSLDSSLAPAPGL